MIRFFLHGEPNVGVSGILTPHIPSEHCAMDTFSFVHDIQDVPTVYVW